MARSGGFGVGLNPFGTGTLGGLSQWNIGDSVRDLERYKAEIAWGNGEMTDEAYLVVLRNDLAAATPGTRDVIEAQNRIDDVVYRIGRAKADADGLDALIAYDQASLARMNPENLRYRDIEESLRTELANRRSRDYGKLVTAYNDGEGSTEELLAYVRKLRESVPDNAPDKDQWAEVETDLVDRLESEKDAEVYQDYQFRRITPEAFLAYVKGRLDSYPEDSPKYDDWARKYEEAQKNVKDTAQAKADQSMFNRYAEGKVSDKTYLTYIRTRIAGMAADDPDKPEWEHRLKETSFSLAEDLLVFQVKTGKKSVGTLVKFYQNYRSGLNSGSAEWRRITEKIMGLRGYTGGSGGGGGGGGGGGSSGGGGTGPVPASVGNKVIEPGKAVDGLLTILTNGSPTSYQALGANQDALMNAVQRGDAYWVYYDPRNPKAMTAKRDPRTGAVIKDANGKPIMVRGSGYAFVNDLDLGKLDATEAEYHRLYADQALATGNLKKFYSQIGQALAAEDRARVHNNAAWQKSAATTIKAMDKWIDAATKAGDHLGVISILEAKANLIENFRQAPGLDEDRREWLDKRQAEVEEHTLWPKIDDASGAQIGGAVNVVDGSLNGGFHYVIDGIKANGEPNPGWAFNKEYEYDPAEPEWRANHVTVVRPGKAVGEATVHTASTMPTVIYTPFGQRTAYISAGAVAFKDDNGQTVRAYTLDGQSWIQSTNGVAPQASVSGLYVPLTDEKGVTSYVDANPVSALRAFLGGRAPTASFINNDDGSVSLDPSDPRVKWQGQREAEANGSGNVVDPFGNIFRLAKTNADKSVNLGGLATTRDQANELLRHANIPTLATKAPKLFTERPIGQTSPLSPGGMSRAPSMKSAEQENELARHSNIPTAPSSPSPAGPLKPSLAPIAALTPPKIFASQSLAPVKKVAPPKTLASQTKARLTTTKKKASVPVKKKVPVKATAKKGQIYAKPKPVLTTAQRTAAAIASKAR